MAISENFLIAQKFTNAAEGGLTDDAKDPGGLTNHGVCIRFLKDLATSQNNCDYLAELGVKLPVTRQSIIDLTKDQASEIFKWQFWDRLSCYALPLRVAILLYDAAVNTGRSQAVKFMQRGYNAVTSGEKLVVDGKLGPKTLAALSDADTPAYHDAFLDARRNFYHQLADNKPKQFEWALKGWLNRCRNLAAYIKDLK